MRYRSCLARNRHVDVCNWYKNGRSLLWIADKLGLSHYSSIRKVLIENGFQIRKQTVNRDNKHKLNVDFFQNIDSQEKAYWLGYITADGYVQQNGYRLTLSYKDKEII